MRLHEISPAKRHEVQLQENRQERKSEVRKLEKMRLKVAKLQGAPVRPSDIRVA